MQRSKQYVSLMTSREASVFSICFVTKMCLLATDTGNRAKRGELQVVRSCGSTGLSIQLALNIYRAEGIQ